MMKRIGISFTETNWKYYLSWFTEKDLQDEVKLIELSFQKNNEEDISTCDGFILTGGLDIHPSLYGGKTEYDNKPKAFEPKRDKFEEKIYNYSQAHQKPLLGICRGLQLVNVLQGGKLIQDLGVQKNLQHKSHDNIDKYHNINIEKGSILFDINHSGNGLVNSAHHQGILTDALGENLIVNAWSDEPQPLMEGIEFKDKTGKAFMLCVQWHPERMGDKPSALSEGIKKAFLQAITKSY